MFLPADHVIENKEEFLRAIKLGDALLQTHPELIVQIGVKPTYPATNFGYIKMSQEKLMDGAFRVDVFKEKPDLETATAYLSSWQYLWNAGIFMARVGTFLNMYKQHLPSIYAGLERIQQTFDTEQYQETLEKEYGAFDKISIDYGIIEKEKNIAVIPTNNLGWTDIGNWKELRDVQSHERDASGNVIQGKVLTIDTKNTLVYSSGKRLVATIGLEDMIVVDTDDCILILPAKDNARVKDIVDEVKKRGMTDYL